ncbi:putative oxidoreductase [Kocuria sp. AG109]|uniref:DoxX family protein n=1 Tax=Rothia kristinae TaxID=37923 RepID=UPI0007736C0C|nr:DoxX family protein [Rothia kristinae]MED6047286.1 DoxX family protein [Rothia kristinae]TDP52339.1 putative oxidoreductase [Kocuria sp. AG109]WGH09264.1 DoxX family protein [Rothia kristinae]SQC30527.1 DoxX [Rothia kristinae]
MSYRNETSTFRASFGLFLLRVVLGIVFLMHGWQKIHTWTVDGTAANFAQMGVPAAELSAAFAAYLEFIGGIALIVGLLSRLAGLLLGLEMLGAIYFAHASAGFFASDGGYEFVLVLALGALALAFTGPGRLAISGAFEGRPGASLLA